MRAGLAGVTDLPAATRFAVRALGAGAFFVMKVGVSGHRSRDGANWAWVRATIKDIAVSSKNVCGYTSLAPGADQIFAEVMLEERKRLVAVVPVCNGEIELEVAEKPAFDRLYSQAHKVIRVEGVTPDEAFLKAGRKVADCVDQMIFVWDGEPSRGLGGTADIVSYAARKRKKGVILDPIACTIRPLDHK